jgi:CDP-diacylglycerol--glycerol-3-phosphate 3-phosphatidyltransferase
MEMNLANKLTMLRVILIPVFVIVLLSPFVSEPWNRYIAVAIFIVASLTDFLDGYIARSRNMVSNFGKFMDPLADKLLVCSAMISMVELGDLPAWVVIIIISREFAITGFRTLAVEANIVIAAAWWGKVKTTVQMIMIIFVLLPLQGVGVVWIEQILIALAVFFTILSGVEYIVKNKTVLKG